MIFHVFPILIVLIFDQISLWYHQITKYSYEKIMSVYPTIHTVYDDAIDFEIYALIKSKKKSWKRFFFFWTWKNVCFNSFLEEITLTRNLACLLHHLCWWTIICDALRDLVPFVEFKKREKQPWRSVTFSKMMMHCSWCITILEYTGQSRNFENVINIH